MMNDTEADWGDASVSVTVTVTGNRPSVVGVPVITPPLKLSPGGRVPVSDQLYGPLPPEGVSDRREWLAERGCCSARIGHRQRRIAHLTLTFAAALCADGDVTSSVSVIDHWFDAAVTESGTLTDPPAGIFTCVAPVLVPLERAQW